MRFHYPYLIIGGGIAADAAARGIRDLDAERPIGMIAAEPHPPYDRPPLSKELWKGGSIEKIWRGTEEFGVELHLGRAAQALDPLAREVRDDRGTIYSFDSLLLATGGTPRRLPRSAEEVVYFRTFDDYHRLREIAERAKRFAVIGAGFIGSEIAAALAQHGKEVVMLFEEEGIGGRIFPADLSHHLNEFYRSQGIELWVAEGVTSVRSRRGELVVTTRTGRGTVVDAIVAGLGIVPNTQLARAAGLPVADGIVVDEFLRTARPDIYAAGDVASFHNPLLGRRLRVEHEDNANSMGWQAGRAMAGEPAPYHHLPYFYSDFFDFSYEAVGELDGQRMTTVADWREPYREGVVYYLMEERVRGVLLWNVRARLTAARRLLEEPGPHRPEDLMGRLTPRGA